jgi:hypothetical protein
LENQKERDFLEGVWGKSEVHVKWIIQKLRIEDRYLIELAQAMV